jgi:hypothetical protein
MGNQDEQSQMSGFTTDGAPLVNEDSTTNFSFANSSNNANGQDSNDDSTMRLGKNILTG